MAEVYRLNDDTTVTSTMNSDVINLHPHEALLTWYTLRPFVCLSLCLSQAGIVSKQLNVLGWAILSVYLQCVAREVDISDNKATSLWNFVRRKLWTWENVVTHGTPTVASDVNLVLPTTVVSLSHRALFTFCSQHDGHE